MSKPGPLSYARGYSTLFTTLLGVYKILLIQVWNIGQGFVLNQGLELTELRKVWN